ncbi:hypothetical protein [Rhizobium leguminosarum]|uniref:hypothetical protein n=1 Tax=Rhizobium leguminosarum TaxID=384 RepID=UPI001C93A33B|nr:hypothetical protein [Rhizobium leguminosarum]MBY5349585.1 hypothetical protein [Rhizobium leguminosarum]
MGMTNAERQAKHRARVKDRLAAVSAPHQEPLRNDIDAREEGIDAAEKMLIDAYYGVAETYRNWVGDSSQATNAELDRAIGAFLAEGIGFIDLIRMMKACAFDRINDHVGGHPNIPVRKMSWRKHADDMAGGADISKRGVT